MGAGQVCAGEKDFLGEFFIIIQDSIISCVTYFVLRYQFHNNLSDKSAELIALALTKKSNNSVTEIELVHALPLALHIPRHMFQMLLQSAV